VAPDAASAGVDDLGRGASVRDATEAGRGGIPVVHVASEHAGREANRTGRTLDRAAARRIESIHRDRDRLVGIRLRQQTEETRVDPPCPSMGDLPVEHRELRVGSGEANPVQVCERAAGPLDLHGRRVLRHDHAIEGIDHAHLQRGVGGQSLEEVRVRRRRSAREHHIAASDLDGHVEGAGAVRRRELGRARAARSGREVAGGIDRSHARVIEREQDVGPGQGGPNAEFVDERELEGLLDHLVEGSRDDERRWAHLEPGWRGTRCIHTRVVRRTKRNIRRRTRVALRHRPRHRASGEGHRREGTPEARLPPVARQIDDEERVVVVHVASSSPCTQAWIRGPEET
jgi:hypothetical protein